VAGTHSRDHSAKHVAALTLGALGVVFGDIGTSPLYALRECFHGPHAATLSETTLYGVLSLMFWALIAVVTLKYLLFVMRADNKGEGGEMALLALINKHRPQDIHSSRRIFIFLGIFGAALIYGDGMITPAISVVSAVEGLKVVTPIFEPYVIPITLAILTVLFGFQKYGTAKIGAVFGPVICLWFVTLGVLGVSGITLHPEILRALSPGYAIEYFQTLGWGGFAILGGVFLVLTGAEALYADMGHFGRLPIRIGWFGLVFPSLMLNYLGQGALILHDPGALENPFYKLAPEWFILPLVGLATLATIVASQALISGAFSITRQAVQLGFLPRLEIRHTSSEEIGQIYIPFVNWVLFGAVVWLVVTFQTSTRLADAYGVAVSTTMIVTSILTIYIAATVWRWNRYFIGLLLITLLAIDIAFFAANFGKFFRGGWFPLSVGVVVFVVMATWKRGRAILARRLQERLPSPEKFLKDALKSNPRRLPGTAIFMARSPKFTPSALFHNFKHNQVLHERVILLTINTEEIPHVPAEGRIELDPLGSSFFAVTLHYGFMDTPNIPEALRDLAVHGLELFPVSTTYYLSRETLIPTPLPGMALWRERLFAFMSRNAQRAATYYRIPSQQVVEIGVQVEL
jgi:KUP system potassium uptake protein